MSYRKSLAAALVATTVLSGAAFAADQAARPAMTQETQAQRTAAADVGKLSKDGIQAFRDMHLARLAIFDADPTQAKDLIGKAQAALTKAKSDEAIFIRAEADLKNTADMSALHNASAKASAQTATAADSKADAKTASAEKVAWLPIDAQLTLGEDFVATPQKAAAVTDANKSLQKGDKQAALQKLKLADIDVNFTVAVLPLDKTAADVNQAATLIDQGKYYEANALLKTTENRMRFDVIDAVGAPKAAAATTNAKAAPNTTGSTQSGTPAK